MNLKRHYYWVVPLIIMSVILVCILLIGEYLESAKGSAVNEDKYDDMIYEACQKYMPSGWDWLILKALIKQESKFDARASNGNAVGIMQFMPGTAESMGLPPHKRDDPSLAIPAGARYLRTLWDSWKAEEDGPPAWDRTKFALASYNAGPGNVLKAQEAAGGTDRYKKLEPHLPPHTQGHVSKVMEFFREYRQSGRYRKPSGSIRGRRSRVRFWVNPMKKN